MTPSRQPLWIYKREPAGMGEWCYRIYRNNHYMLYAESESIAMIICNGLNRDEDASHTSAQAPTQGTSKLCFGTQHPASECCQQCNELETCKQKQRYLDYDKAEAAKAAREQVLDAMEEWINSDDCLTLYKWQVRESIRFLRSQQEPSTKGGAR